MNTSMHIERASLTTELDAKDEGDENRTQGLRSFRNKQYKRVRMQCLVPFGISNIPGRYTSVLATT